MLSKSLKIVCASSIYLYLFLVRTSYTDADIFAERVVRKNQMSAITLDVSVKNTINDNNISNIFHSSGLLPGGFDIGLVRIAGGSSKFLYSVAAEKINGNDSL